MAFNLDFIGSQLNRNMDKLGSKFGVAILMYAATKATELEASMKTNRPWTDRTNMAKSLLSAKVSQPDSSTIRITLAHGVEYGIWLELAHEKNYAIIAPTIEKESPKIVQGLSNIMAKVKI